MCATSMLIFYLQLDDAVFYTILICPQSIHAPMLEYIHVYDVICF